VNPGVTRLLIVVALVVGGVVVLAQGFDAESAAPPTSPEPTTPPPENSPSPTPRDENGGEVVGQTDGVLVQVLNGTFTPGLAGDFALTLENDGYLRGGEPGDAPDKPIVDTVVYFRNDDSAAQNEADARLLAETYLTSDVPVERLPREYQPEAVTDPAADVIVVLGEDAA
jgi:LytR cell envelope-related transcriptional attenuator